jgi:hypothetical protein
MTASELFDLCVHKRRECKFYGDPEPLSITVMVPRRPTGTRMRVMPGLMGEVLHVSTSGCAFVSVDIDKAEAYARRVIKAKAEEVPRG